MTNNNEQAGNLEESPVLCDSFITKVAGYRFYAATAGPGEWVFFDREPGNPHDSNAIAVCDQGGQIVGHLFHEIAREWAAPLDEGCVCMVGRLAAPGEPGYDARRARTNPTLFVWIYANDAGRDGVLAQPA
jgi:hypothetical protein